MFDKSLKTSNDKNNSNVNDELTGQKNNKFMKKFIRLHALLFDFTKQSLQTRLDIFSIQIDLGIFHKLLSNANNLEEKSKILNKLTLYAQSKKNTLSLPQFNVYFFEELTQFVMQDLDSFLASGSFGSSRLLTMLLIICLFSVHHSSMTVNIRPSTTSDDARQLSKSVSFSEYIRDYLLKCPNNVVYEYNKPHEYSAPESVALSLLFNFITR